MYILKNKLASFLTFFLKNNQIIFVIVSKLWSGAT